MKQGTTFAGCINSQGQLKLDARDRAVFDRMCRNLKGKRVELSMRKFTKKRSIPQNRWVWGVLVPVLAEHCGVDPEDYESLYMELKRKFLGTVTLKGDIEVVKRSRDLTTVEYSRFMEDCQRFCAELGVDVPMPHEVAA